MNKQEFLKQLRDGLNGLPGEEIEERITFYSEMIDDRMEEGLSEEEAVAEIGPVDGIVSQAVEDIPFTKYIKDRITSKRKLSTLEIVLLVLGSPIWLSLLIVLFSVVFSVNIVLGAVIISLWAVFGALVACGVSGILGGIGFLITGYGISGMVMIAAAFICVGISIYLFFGCKMATQGLYMLIKKYLLGIKKCFIKREVI